MQTKRKEYKWERFRNSMDEIQKLSRLFSKKFSNDEEYYEHLMYEIQNHLVMISDRKEQNDPTLADEVIDLAILSQLLRMQQARKGAIEPRCKILASTLKS